MAQAKDFIFEEIGVILEKLSEWKERPLSDIRFEYIECDYKTSNEPPAADAGWKEFAGGQRMDGIDEHFWIHFNIDAVDPVDGKELIFSMKTAREGQWDARNPQGTVYIDGRAVQALDTNHTWIPLEFGKSYDVYIYMYTGMQGGYFELLPSLILRDNAVYSLYYDILVPYEAMQELDRESYDYIKIKNALNKALFLLDLRRSFSEDFYKGISAAADYLRNDFYGKCGESDATVSCIGHTHIDVAWLWTVRQTREKAERSFSTVLNLMRRYPEYKFMSSQPQLYQHVKEVNPEMYEEIKERVREGRWEVEGAMWLEADCNLISGESMVRQILYGKRFMQEEFGVDSRILWLPDVFGYSAALPQILKKSGVDRFFTSKIAWNEYNKMPHDTFMWRGIDGTEIFTSFIETYVRRINTKWVLNTWESYKDKSMTNETLITFGFGDGGGGPTAEMLEQHDRIKLGIPGIPKTVIKKAGDFFDNIEKDFRKNASELRVMPKWDGELYLEMHRGTYTSIAKNKRNNRKSELLYQQAETLSVLDKLMLGGSYDEETMRRNQTNILLNQFHDIIPGSSIKEVYDVTDVEYERILREGRAIADEKLKAICENIATEGGLFVYNPTPFKQSGTVTVDGKRVIAESIPAHGYKVLHSPKEESGITVTANTIENDVIKVVFDENYEITSVFDKTEGREVIESGVTANRFEVYEDYPREFDAWEITNYYKQKMWHITTVDSAETLDNGIRIKRSYGDSVIVQDITLNAGSKRIDFATEIDWHEDHVLLKTLFPVDIHSNRATYDIQFGNIERPTHYNTTWDEAKFEVCGHKWADLSEGGYGVSILNDCKYGYGIHENVMSLSLLKAATYPNPEADRGMHTFTYSLYPHTGGFVDGGTVKESYLLNMPMETAVLGKNEGKLPEEYSLVSVDAENVALETVKKAESDDSTIIRMFEFENKKTETEIEFGFDVKELYLCDLLENASEKLEVCGNKARIKLSNYEIVTLKPVTK